MKPTNKPAEEIDNQDWEELKYILMPAELVPDLEAQITNQIKDLLAQQKEEFYKHWISKCEQARRKMYM